MVRKASLPTGRKSPLTRNERRILNRVAAARAELDSLKKLIRGRYLESHKWEDRGDHWDAGAISESARSVKRLMKEIDAISTEDYSSYIDGLEEED